MLSYSLNPKQNYLEDSILSDTGYDIGEHDLKLTQDRPEFNFFYGKWTYPWMKWSVPFFIVISFTLDVVALNYIFVTV